MFAMEYAAFGDLTSMVGEPASGKHTKRIYIVNYITPQHGSYNQFLLLNRYRRGMCQKGSKTNRFSSGLDSLEEFMSFRCSSGQHFGVQI